MNLLMFSLAVDCEHVTLGFGLKWIERLAKHFDHIDIITMYQGKHSLPSNVNVYSAGRERDLPLWRRVLRFYRLMFEVLRKRRHCVAFAHMIPEFSILFWPFSLLLRIPCILWYAHGHVPFRLCIAHLLATHCVSSTPEGFRLPSHKVTFIGQGIDADLYQYSARTPGDRFEIVTVGRIAPSKGQMDLIEALALWQKTAPRPWRLTIIGDATNDEEKAYAARVREAASTSLPEGQVVFTGRLDAAEIAGLLKNADLSISLGKTGSLDKTIVESMACGCPLISSNDAFRTIALKEGFADCILADRSPKEICAALARFADKPPAEREKTAKQQSLVALRDHALDGLINRLVDILHQKAKKDV